MTTTDHGGRVTSSELHHGASDKGIKTRQLPLWPAAIGPWSRDNPPAVWLEVARALPANLGLEFTAEHGWRIITLGVETRRALELLDVVESDVIPDAVMLERRRRHTAAQLQLEQARAVLRAVQAEHETATALRRLSRERVA